MYVEQVGEGDKSDWWVMPEAGWEAEQLLPRYWALIVLEHRGRGREVISLNWTLVSHERGPHNCSPDEEADAQPARGGCLVVGDDRLRLLLRPSLMPMFSYSPQLNPVERFWCVLRR